MDKARQLTDKRLNTLENRVLRVFSRAKVEVEAKVKKSIERQEKSAVNIAKQKAVEAGQMTEAEYNQWRLQNLLGSKYYRDLLNSINADLINAQQIAADLANENMLGIYALNANYGAYEVEFAAQVDAGFQLVNEQAVRNLLTKNPKLLPKSKVDIPKASLWNKKKMQAELTQGILQGESVQRIAKRMRRVTASNAAVAIRNARTMTTAAEGGGRFDTYLKYAEMGIKGRIVWVATNDMKTRFTHAMQSGTSVEVGERFPNGLRFPGDMSGEGSEVYNCRCSSKYIMEGIDYDAGDFQPAEVTTFEKWERGHKNAK